MCRMMYLTVFKRQSANEAVFSNLPATINTVRFPFLKHVQAVEMYRLKCFKCCFIFKEMESRGSAFVGIIWINKHHSLANRCIIYNRVSVKQKPGC